MQATVMNNYLFKTVFNYLSPIGLCIGYLYFLCNILFYVHLTRIDDVYVLVPLTYK